jgi:hypothetical protein
MPAINPRDVTFLELRDAMLCSECELISYNNTPRCLACGSRAVLSLARVLGGTLRGEERVRLTTDAPPKTVIEMRPVSQPRLVRPAAAAPQTPAPVAIASEFEGAGPVALSPADHFPPSTERAEGARSAVSSAMKLVVERAYRLSRSGGAAIALNRHGRMVCEARMGALAPSLGAEVRGGLSDLCARSARTLRCDLASDDARVNALSCRQLGAQSVVAAPVTNLDRVLGLITVLSPMPYAFDNRDVAVVQWLAGMMAVVFTGVEADLSRAGKASRRPELTARA